MSPDEIKDLALPVLGHRMILKSGMRNRSTQIEGIVNEILDTVPAPTEDWKIDQYFSLQTKRRDPESVSSKIFLF